MDVKQVARGIADGIASIPGGVYFSVVRTVEGSGVAGSRIKARNEYETERFMKLLKAAANREEPIRRLISIIVTDFYLKLDAQSRDAINARVEYGSGKLTGRVSTQFLLAQYISKRILSKIWHTEAYKRLFRVGTAFSLNILLIQGLIEEAARASRRLQGRYPATYMQVSPMNLDMVYFLVERELEPYIIFINSHQHMCKRIQREVVQILAN